MSVPMLAPNGNEVHIDLLEYWAVDLGVTTAIQDKTVRAVKRAGSTWAAAASAHLGGRLRWIALRKPWLDIRKREGPHALPANQN